MKIQLNRKKLLGFRIIGEDKTESKLGVKLGGKVGDVPKFNSER